MFTHLYVEQHTQGNDNPNSQTGGYNSHYNAGHCELHCGQVRITVRQIPIAMHTAIERETQYYSRLKTSQNGEGKKVCEICMVCPAHTMIYPRTMMVHFLNASIT